MFAALKFTQLNYLLLLLSLAVLASPAFAQCSAPDDDSYLQNADGAGNTVWNLYVVFNDTEYHYEGQAHVSYINNSSCTDCDCISHGAYHSQADDYEYYTTGPDLPDCTYGLEWYFFGPKQTFQGCGSGTCQATGKVESVEEDGMQYGSYLTMDSPF